MDNITYGYHTYDTFGNDIKGIRYFNFCRLKALDCGLTCRCIVENNAPKLEMWGNKHQFLKYYTITVFKCDKKFNGIKRIIEFIFD